MAENSNRCSYLLNRIQGFSSNTFKLMPQGSTSTGPNQIVNITLPANCLLNLKSFALFFDASITSAGAQGRLPNNISSLISRYDVKIGGNVIQSGCNFYNVLHNAKNYLGCQKVCPLMEHPEVVAVRSPYTSSGTSGITANKEVANTYAITNWDGFLGTCTPSIIDSGLVGDIVISIQLADNDVLVDASAATLDAATIGTTATAPAAVYKLENIYATIETLSMADGTYDQMVSGIIQSRGYLELPFKNYISFQDTTSSAMRFQVATQSLDRIWVVHRADAYSTQGGAVFVSGYLRDAAANNTQYDPVLGYNKQKLISKYFNYAQPSAGFKTQFQLNGSLVPQYQASAHDWAVITKNSLPSGAKEPDWSMLTFLNNYCVYCLRMNLPDSEDQRIISGVNTLGISLNAFMNLYNNASTRTINIFCETTACLKIGSGLQTELVL